MAPAKRGKKKATTSTTISITRTRFIAPKKLPRAPPSLEEAPRFSFNLHHKKTLAFLQPYLFKAVNGIKKAAVKWSLDLPRGTVLDHYVYQGADSTRCGSRVIGKEQRKHNEMNYRSLWSLCALIGDYESMLMLLPTVPEHAPSMKAETCELMLRFKRQAKNTPLMRTGSNSAQQVRDIFGNKVYAQGGWNNPKGEWILTAGITGLHQNHGHTGEGYCKPCGKCMRKLDQSKGCVHHVGQPLLRRMGDPTKCQDYRNAKIFFQKAGKDYVEKGCSQLLPADVRRMHDNLMSAPCLANLQMWTIMLTATLLFLRWDEYHDIKGEDFKEELFHIPGTTKVVEELALAVKGKADSIWVTLKLVADHLFPEMCGPRTLLLYLDAINWKGGYIFPSMKEINEKMNDPNFDGIYTTHVDYEKFNKELQELVAKVLPGRNLKIGSHTFRKTGYCLAIFGNACHADLRKLARHSAKSKDAPSYEKDTGAACESHCRTPNAANNVRQWSNIRIEEHSNAQAMAAYAGSDHHKMRDLPKHFRKEVLGIGDDHQEKDNITFLMARAAGYATSNDAQKRLDSFLSTFSPERKQELEQLIQDAMLEQRRRETFAARNQLPNDATPAVAVVTPPRKRTPEEELPEQPAKKKKSKNNLDEKKDLQCMTTEDKVKTMLGWKQKKQENGPYTDAANQFFKKSINPVLHCLEKHCNGEIDTFCSKYPNFAHSTFTKRCCKGKGDTCSL